jgi:uncharacterized membrane protein YGL010W
MKLKRRRGLRLASFFMVYALRDRGADMLGGKTSEQWVAQYSTSHQHPVNRACHTLGIPTIIISLVIGAAALIAHWLWIYALGLFLFGWTLQFVGHAFERKWPEFFHDWRFLFVGVRWWWTKTIGGNKL